MRLECTVGESWSKGKKQVDGARRWMKAMKQGDGARKKASSWSKEMDNVIEDGYGAGRKSKNIEQGDRTS